MIALGTTLSAGGTFSATDGIAFQTNPFRVAAVRTYAHGATAGAGWNTGVFVTQFPDMRDLNSLGGPGFAYGGTIDPPMLPINFGVENVTALRGDGQPDFHDWSATNP